MTACLWIGLAFWPVGAMAAPGQAPVLQAPADASGSDHAAPPGAKAVSATPAVPTPEPHAPAGEESVQQALCRLIDGAAAKHHVPVGFLTRLIWQESSFRSNAISPAGAQGIAQFMPGTAQERGLANPFDPEQAIPASAAMLAELSDRFGNLGLAAAAYNGGPNRVAAWLAGTGGLPFETRQYVLRITGREAEDWQADLKARSKPAKPATTPPETCLQITADLRISKSPAIAGGEAAFAPWGVQLAGNFSKALALASYARAQQRYQTVLGDIRPMIIGTRLRSRGTRRFYRVRAPAASRTAANTLCNRIRAIHGSCIVLRS
jgi:hypothetical protein